MPPTSNDKTTHAGQRLVSYREPATAQKAVILLHGFGGNESATWAKLPEFLRDDPELQDWDIYSLGYNTSLLPGLKGIWSADPELDALAQHFRTKVDLAPLDHYGHLAIAAHSMGGLVVQKALVDSVSLVERTDSLTMFGVPSDGLFKASLFSRLFGGFGQVDNMAHDGLFVRDLRSRWTEKFGAKPPFLLTVVAGTKDEFVPRDSSLRPFPPSVCKVINGDHLSMVKPTAATDDAVVLLKQALLAKRAKETQADVLRKAAEFGPTKVAVKIAVAAPVDLSEKEIVDAALALERDGKPKEARSLLEKHQSVGTDVRGALGGRIKRLWIQNQEPADAELALSHYQGALDSYADRFDKPKAGRTSEQIYYLAINVAFLELMAFDDEQGAQKMAQLALKHAQQTAQDFWSLATQAEARLHLLEFDPALSLYRKCMKMKKQDDAWKVASTAQQAMFLGQQLGGNRLTGRLKKVFEAVEPTPPAERGNRVFVSYSHADKADLDELLTMLKPLIRSGRLEMWTDRGIQPGDQWDAQIKAALETCRAAFLIVTEKFLASDYIYEKELPYLVAAADRNDIRLLWAPYRPSLYTATELKRFQAIGDPAKPIEGLPKIARGKALLEIANTLASLPFDENGAG
ncbi:MAG: TIR domain-containing protein [Acidobacteria bacterium]|nr:TIR domain-containing protein [Acidobacteriota bacterium]